MTVEYYAEASIGGSNTINHAEIIVVEKHWLQDDGWQQGDIVDSAQWRYTFYDKKGTIIFEPLDNALERMGWRKLHQHYWVDIGSGYVTSVKPAHT